MCDGLSAYQIEIMQRKNDLGRPDGVYLFGPGHGEGPPHLRQAVGLFGQHAFL
jgi:hypothetical protein